MNNIYFDCRSGVSGDMVFSALLGLVGAEEDAIREALAQLAFTRFHHEHEREIADIHAHHSHRSYREIQEFIKESPISAQAQKIALDIYAVVAKAEAFVHETTIAEVHFHEVGRDEAIRNMVGIALCMDRLGVAETWCSPIHDGSGFIECSHGRIPVPVPAVMAMRKDCDYIFVTDDVQTEMVTPSGLAILIGLGAVCTESLPRGQVLRESVVYGKRQTGKTGGFKAILISQE